MKNSLKLETIRQLHIELLMMGITLNLDVNSIEPFEPSPKESKRNSHVFSVFNKTITGAEYDISILSLQTGNLVNKEYTRLIKLFDLKTKDVYLYKF